MFQQTIKNESDFLKIDTKSFSHGIYIVKTY